MCLNNSYAILSQKDQLSLKIAQISLQNAKFPSRLQDFPVRRFPQFPTFPRPAGEICISGMWG